MSYVVPIIAARLSSKEKSSLNFDPIVTKLGTNVDLIKIQIRIENEIWGANKIVMTFI